MRVMHGVTELAVDPSASISFGRSVDNDLTISVDLHDASVSRRAGVLTHDGFVWRVTNIGRRAFFVVQLGAERELVPGQAASSGEPLVSADPWIRIPTAGGDRAVVLHVPTAERPSSPLVQAATINTETLLEERIELTPNELRSVVAVYANYLALPPQYRREPHSFRAAAHRLRAEEGKVKADLRRVQDKVSRAGGPAAGGSRYRDALIAWLVSRGAVHRDDLGLLDEANRCESKGPDGRAS